MQYGLIIFDFDGTLADTFPWFAGVLNRVAETYGFRRIGAQDVETLRGLEGREILRHLGVPLWQAPRIAHHLRGLMARDIHTVSLFPGVREALHGLAGAGIPLAVVSSNGAENIGTVLGEDTAALFQTYACGVSMFGKERKLRRVVRDSRVPRERIIYVGDEIRDLRAARTVKIAFGAVSWGYNRVEAIRGHGPDRTFSTVADMAAQLGAAGPP